jgi:hydroxymethylpyrimidine kinase/phosphomethylpyrimidine kinase/thiamine-phosphate diphosphorylase
MNRHAMNTPIVWSVAGLDSGGGAGLSADQRAAEACEVHLCPVAAAVTAQNTVAVTRIDAVSPDMLDAQLAALADDLPPAAIKTGLLGSAENARVLARWVDRLREGATHRGHAPALIVDPVLRASTGAAFADESLLAAYREHLLPRATVITPNRSEASALLGATAAPVSVPEQAAALRALGAQAVCITGGDDAVRDRTLALDWIDTPHARGWLSLRRVPTPHTHGTGCTYACTLAAAIARGFVSADAAVLAKMATTRSLQRAQALGRGVGPVRAAPDFIGDPRLLPRLSLDDSAPAAWTTPDAPREAPGLYAIVDSIERLRAVLQTGAASTVQLRIKTAQVDAALRERVAASIVLAREAGVRLYVNDHWTLALELGADAVHLGQEDLFALTLTERERLHAAQRAGLHLGISSHSLWELCRAAALQPSYIACGPVWPTETKRMPWHPQGLHNLAWWSRMAPAPVVAIGGILSPDQLREAAAAGASGGCVVRGLGETPQATLPDWQRAWRAGTAAFAESGATAAGWPTPSLSP